MSIKFLALAGAAALAVGPAFASGSAAPAAGSMAGNAMKPVAAGKKMGMNAPDAMKHFAAIGSGNVKAIMAQYAPHANLQWVGGKLNGDYRGTDAIQDMWTKFAHAVGPLKATVTHVTVGTAPNMGMTVTADVMFKGKAAIPVRYVLVYRGRKIVDEVWQLAPNLKTRMM